MKIKEIVDALERFAPLPLQDGFDNAGMQVGLTEAEVTGALLCLDVTEAVIDEAVALGYNLIVAHHPLLFHPLKSVTGANYTERCLIKAIRNGIAIYAAHTNVDNVAEGVNFKIAEKIGLTRLRFLEEKEGGVGGSGIIGVLEQPETELAFLKRIKQTFEAGCVRHNRLSGRELTTVALCGGAGAFLMPRAIQQHADVFLTGEIRYHEYFGHDDELLLVEIGHYESEQYTKEIFQRVLAEQFPQLPVQRCRVNTNPIKYM
jgi:dinuclear metal center YbgI/SA1388 family protein